jgi:hypothetical protein
MVRDLLKALSGGHGGKWRTGHRHPHMSRQGVARSRVASYSLSSHHSQCRPIPILCQSPFSTMTMLRREASALMTSVSSSQALNPVHACPSCSPNRRHSYSSEDTRHKAPILHLQHLLVTMTLRRHQSRPDPRKHRLISSTYLFD